MRNERLIWYTSQWNKGDLLFKDRGNYGGTYLMTQIEKDVKVVDFRHCLHPNGARRENRSCWQQWYPKRRVGSTYTVYTLDALSETAIVKHQPKPTEIWVNTTMKHPQEYESLIATWSNSEEQRKHT